MASTVLMRVWHDGAWAAPTLDAELRRAAQLDSRDRGLATELVYGVLRTQRALEKAIGKHAQNDRWKKQHQVHAQMCIAAYAIMFLRVPSYAAVSEAVGAVKATKGRRVGGFVNAVLRKLSDAEDHPTLEQAVKHGVPNWLASALDDVLGREGAQAFIAAPVPAPLCICLRSGESRDAWCDKLGGKPSALAPRCILLSGAGDYKKLPGSGVAWHVQEEGAQVLAHKVGAGKNDVVLDACAGRGNKTRILADEALAVDAADLHPNKLRHVGVARNTYAVDWSKGSGDVPADYDRVLVDAPCSGTGTLRRRPEIAARLAASDITRLAALQLTITRAAATRLKPGGTLVYAVCSILREECEGVVDALIAQPRKEAGELSLVEPPMRLLPHEHGTDGYFVATLLKS